MPDTKTMDTTAAPRVDTTHAAVRSAASPVTPSGTLPANNGDEADLLGSDGNPNYIGNFHKGLPHNEFGEVVPAAYQSLLKAVTTHDAADFEAIIMGQGAFGKKLTSPQAGLATDTEGPNPTDLTIPPAPKLNSAREASEMAEVYWMALLRDVAFTDYATSPLAAAAADDLSKMSEYHAFKINGNITPATLFRGDTISDITGPYVSQYLWRDIPYGSLTISQRQKTVLPGKDYQTNYGEWLNIQNGHEKLLADAFDSTPRYIRNGRDLGQYVHVDQLYEAYLNAALILLGNNAPVDNGNPYAHSKNQAGFATFGGPHLLSLVTEVATRALKCVWYQKWIVHRRLRPEAFGGLVHLVLAGNNGTKKNYPLHADILNSEAVHATYSKYGTYLLPTAFPEGSPTHPAYGAGHATVAGACVTILKAWFNEDAPITNPIVPDADGTNLIAYTGADKDQMTVGSELNKLAANIATARNMAGVHWRTDYSESVKLGQQVSLSILKQQSNDYNERLPGGDKPSFSLTLFDGTPVKIQGGQVINTMTGTPLAV